MTEHERNSFNDALHKLRALTKQQLAYWGIVAPQPMPVQAPIPAPMQFGPSGMPA